MAGDYIEIDHELAEKPEILQIHEATGEEIAVILGRLFLMWRLFDRQTEDGRLNGAGPRSIATICGGSPEFWEAVAAAGWLLFSDGSAVLPDFDKRFGRSARKRMKDAIRKRKERKDKSRTSAGRPTDVTRTEEDASEPRPPLSVSVSVSPSVSGKSDHLCSEEEAPEIDVTGCAKELITFCRDHFSPHIGGLLPSPLSKDQRNTLFRIAAIWHRSKITLADVKGALEAIRLRTEGPPKKPIAFLITVLADKSSVDIHGLLRRVRLPPERQLAPPRSRPP